MRALTEADYRDVPGGMIDVKLLQDDQQQYRRETTVCENCGTEVGKLAVRLGDGAQWELAWWEVEPFARPHTVERCRAARASAPLVFGCAGCGTRLTTVPGRPGAREVDSVAAPLDDTARQLMLRHTLPRCRAYRAANGEGRRG